MKRQSRRLASSLEHRLSGYALAASAAGVSLRALLPIAQSALPAAGLTLVGAVAMPESAEAKIVYTPASSALYCHGTSGFCHGTLKLDLNHDGMADFKLTANYGHPGNWLDLVPVNKQNEGWTTIVTNGGSSWGSFAVALHKGKVIQRNAKFHQGRAFGMFYYYSHNASFELGPWVDVQNRYLGLKFYIKGKAHYGWARLSTGTCCGGNPWATLTGYAYETIADKPIIAGKTKGPDVITLEPASLGRLARGASAIPAWRGKD